MLLTFFVSVAAASEPLGATTVADWSGALCDAVVLNGVTEVVTVAGVPVGVPEIIVALVLPLTPVV